MTATGMTRETRIGLALFAVLGLAVSCNMLLLQGRRLNQSLETATILKPGPILAAQNAPTANDEAGMRETPGGVLTLSPPQPAVRPLPVAIAPPASLSRGDVVRSIQRGLGVQGYEPGTPDGIMGLMTRAAIMAYEFDNGLALTAEPSEDLMRRIEQGSAAAAPGSRKATPSVKTLEAATLIRNVGTWLSAIGYPVTKTETSMTAPLMRSIRDYEASQKMPETGRISAPLVARLSRAGQSRAAVR